MSQDVHCRRAQSLKEALEECTRRIFGEITEKDIVCPLPKLKVGKCLAMLNSTLPSKFVKEVDELFVEAELKKKWNALDKLQCEADSAGLPSAWRPTMDLEEDTRSVRMEELNATLKDLEDKISVKQQMLEARAVKKGSTKAMQERVKELHSKNEHNLRRALELLDAQCSGGLTSVE